MKERFLKDVPDWYKSNDNFDLVLSDDLDGLVSTSVLNYVHPNWNVNYFYDFATLYASEDIKEKSTRERSATRVWADIAFLGTEKCFDNHVSRANKEDYKNELCINPNLMTGVYNTNYYSKYAGSTALVIWSLYGLPLPKSELGKGILLAIDSTYEGYFSGDNFKARNKFYLCDVLGLEELYECQGRHNYSDFKSLANKYDLREKIKINEDGKISTALDTEWLSKVLDLPITFPKEKIFTPYVEFEKQNKANSPVLFLNDSVRDIKNIATIGYTHKNKAKYSTIKRIIK